jgi:hypothetical protein
MWSYPLFRIKALIKLFVIASHFTGVAFNSEIFHRKTNSREENKCIHCCPAHFKVANVNPYLPKILLSPVFIDSALLIASKRVLSKSFILKYCIFNIAAEVINPAFSFHRTTN